MDWLKVAEGLAAAAGQIPGVNPHPALPPSVTVPAFVVLHMEGSIEGHCAERLTVTCGLLVRLMDDRAAAADIYQYAAADGDLSVMRALEADQTLGGVCNTVTVTTRRAPQVLTVGSNDYVAAELAVEVDGSFDGA